MNKINVQLDKIRSENRVGLMTHVIVGYPTLNETIPVVKAMEESGVDFVELQIPFSDPLADGPTIMKACEQSLAQGTKVKDAFEIATKLTKEVSIPILFMAYFNTVFRYGTEKFCKAAKKAGISGLLVPDMPIEEEDAERFLAFCKQNDLHAVRVVSPASTDERLIKNAKIAEGFVYCTARQGITGAQKELDPTIESYLQRVHAQINLPLAVGFGISKREHIMALAPHAEVAVIGSALIDTLHESTPRDRIKNVKAFLKPLVGIAR